jgi:hypothetical protein
MRRFLCLGAVAAMLLSCTSGGRHVQTAIRFRYPHIDLYGPYAREWTVDDVRQVVALANARRDIQYPIYQIEAQRPNEARVISGHPQKNGDLQTDFTVRKHHGRWLIIEKSIDTGPVVIVS